MMLLPQDIIERPGLSRLDKAIVTLAKEQKVELDRAGTILLTVVASRMVTECLDLIPDPLKRTLTARPESPYLPTLKLK